jgi:hypothetical protein
MYISHIKIELFVTRIRIRIGYALKPMRINNNAELNFIRSSYITLV